MFNLKMSCVPSYILLLKCLIENFCIANKRVNDCNLNGILIYVKNAF